MGVFFFQAEDGIRDAQESRGLGDVYKRQAMHSAKFDLNLVFGEADDGAGLTAIWEYNSDLFDRTTIEQMARHLQQLLRAALAAPAGAVFY